MSEVPGCTTALLRPCDKFFNGSVSLQVVVRGKVNDAVVTKMPFVPNTYYKEPLAKSES